MSSNARPSVCLRPVTRCCGACPSSCLTASSPCNLASLTWRTFACRPAGGHERHGADRGRPAAAVPQTPARRPGPVQAHAGAHRDRVPADRVFGGFLACRPGFGDGGHSEWRRQRHRGAVLKASTHVLGLRNLNSIRVAQWSVTGLVASGSTSSVCGEHPVILDQGLGCLPPASSCVSLALSEHERI